MNDKTYHTFESALIDLVRVGASGNGAGVRQLANRLLRSLPEDMPGRERFRKRLGEAMVGDPGRPTFRAVAAPPAPTGRSLVHWSNPHLGDLPRLFLNPDTQSDVDQLLAQWSEQAKLAEAGLTAANTLLVSGPPGVGKTLLAHHLAAHLGLPLATMNIAEVISSLLGGTGKNLRDAMQAALEVEGVLLVDEFDAVGKRRDDSSDIGELKRIVNVMLLELDHWPADRLLIAATNHAHLLDAAATRRFEMLIEIELLAKSSRLALLQHLLDGRGCTSWASVLVADATAERSPAEIERLVRAARRDALTEGLSLDRALITRAMQIRPEGFDQDLAINELSTRWKLSNRQIAKIFGITHPTVATAIRRFNERSSR